MVKTSLFLLLLLPWIQISKGLQCPSCTYLTSDADIPVVVRTVVDGILNLFQDPECAQELKGPIPEINEETCTEVTEKHSRCSYYKGSVTLTIPLPIVPDVNISLQMYQKGCYYSKLTNVPSDGCHDRENISEDKTVIKQNLEKASSTFKGYNLANLLEKCVCAQKHSVETYNKNDNKTTV